MTARLYRQATLETTRWNAVRLGLRLANTPLDIPRFWFALLLSWAATILLLILGFILFAILGNIAPFPSVRDHIALFPAAIPSGAAFAVAWALRLLSRSLWCAIPGNRMATFAAVAAVAGRLAVLVGAVLLWRWTPFNQA